MQPKTLALIGDTHGNINLYWKIIQKLKINSIQLGDFGFRIAHEWHLKNIDNTKHKVLFGNHDDYTFVNAPHSLGHFGMLTPDIFFIRGAQTVDKAQRIQGAHWWPEEELEYKQFRDAFDLYCLYKPSIVLSHDCPQTVRKQIYNISQKSNTSMALQRMFEEHQPSKWIHGHHHKSRLDVIESTEFNCLSPMEVSYI